MTKIEVFSDGGGVQSNYISALIITGKLAKPDFTIIADTTRERSVVWDYLDSVVAPRFKQAGIEVLRISADDYGYAGSNLFNKKGTLLIPAFSTTNGGVGKLQNFCSTYWKIEAVDNFLAREHGIKRSQYRKWIGFSMNEASRYLRMKISKDGGLIYCPLIEEIPTTRQQALLNIEKLGWPTPPRSACWMCPNQGDHEWRELKAKYPAEFQKAVELEREIQKRDPNAWLHKSCIPLDQVDFTEPEDLFTHACNSGACFV